MARRLAIWMLLGVGLAGCGKAPPPPPPPTVTVTPAAPAAPVGGAPSAPAPGPAPTTPTPETKPKSKIDSSIPDDKVFLVNAEENNFDVVDPQIDPKDEFSVTTAEPARDVVVSGGTIAGASTAKLPEGFTAIPEAGANADGWPKRIRCTADGAEMAYVPGGVFRQGVDGGPADAGPAHATYLDPYYIDIHETTLLRYFQCRNALKEGGKATLAEPGNASQPQDHPATGIMWRDAAAYAKWAKKELPTEAEWEMAGRGNKSFEFPWGNDRAIWERARKPGQIDPVGSFRGDVSLYGVMDLAGNAREWCSDLYLADYYAGAKERDGSAIRNPQGPRSSSTANHRVGKGGKAGWELWNRAGDSMQKSAPDLGFRCVLRIPQEPAAKPK